MRIDAAPGKIKRQEMVPRPPQERSRESASSDRPATPVPLPDGAGAGSRLGAVNAPTLKKSPKSRLTI
jgi:hypothetical protein